MSRKAQSARQRKSPVFGGRAEDYQIAMLIIVHTTIIANNTNKAMIA